MFFGLNLDPLPYFVDTNSVYKCEICRNCAFAWQLFFHYICILYILITPKCELTLANSEEPDEMTHKAALYHGLRFLLDENYLREKHIF